MNEKELLTLALQSLANCNDLFHDIRNDWSDPRTECRMGWAIVERVAAEAQKLGIEFPKSNLEEAE